MNDITTIYIVRHGQSEANAYNNIATKYENGESPLSEKGKKQAIMLAEKLKKVHFDKIFTSHLSRSQDTAAILATNRTVDVITVPNIHERVFGNNREEYTSEKRAKIEGLISTLTEDQVFNFRYSDDGETAGEAYIRFRNFLDEIIPQYLGKTILIVNHGNNMRWFLVRHKFATFKELMPGTIDNCGYFVIESDGHNFVVKETYGIHKKVLN